MNLTDLVPLARWFDDVVLEAVIQKLLDFDAYLDRWQQLLDGEPADSTIDLDAVLEAL